MSILRKIDRYFEEAVCVVFFAVMVILTFLQVLSRFVLNFSLAWTEELSRFLFVYLVYFAAAMAAKHRRHIRVELVDQFFPRKLAKWISVLADLLWFLFVVITAYYGYQLTAEIMKSGQTSAALLMPMGWVYLIVPFGFLLIAFRVIQAMIRDFHKGEPTEEEKLRRAMEEI